jgi:hypothetical protein
MVMHLVRVHESRNIGHEGYLNGGSVSKLLVREGDQLYFYFGWIGDEQERKQAHDLMRGAL